MFHIAIMVISLINPEDFLTGNIDAKFANMELCEAARIELEPKIRRQLEASFAGGVIVRAKCVKEEVST